MASSFFGGSKTPEKTTEQRWNEALQEEVKEVRAENIALRQNQASTGTAAQMQTSLEFLKEEIVELKEELKKREEELAKKEREKESEVSKREGELNAREKQIQEKEKKLQEEEKKVDAKKKELSKDIEKEVEKKEKVTEANLLVVKKRFEEEMEKRIKELNSLGQFTFPSIGSGDRTNRWARKKVLELEMDDLKRRMEEASNNIEARHSLVISQLRAMGP